ncbi:alpha/beta-hydrolase [Flagelloscypha sp. PMI_526]|nr:alpha/beta-hydrolase [Flagelloscypha sp. PMI_526]
MPTRSGQFTTISLSTLGLATLCSAISTTVELDYGIFQGKLNSGYVSFQGIKYADAPRFQAPIMPPSQNLGTVNATQCNLRSTSFRRCLFVNVYVPNGVEMTSNVPVLAWFHGGGFLAGNSHSELPDDLFNSTTSPFIFTSFEYRLGPYGFLAGKEVEKQGALNIGLRDQRAGLEWLQKYITSFGGNPSAGAASTIFHLTWDCGDNHGVFARALGDSPSYGSQPPKDDGYIANLYTDFATRAGCAGSDSFTCLSNANISTLMAASAALYNARMPTQFAFTPVLDGVHLTETVSSALQHNRFAKVPVLFGANTDDGSSWADPYVNDVNSTLDNVFYFVQANFVNLTRETFDRAISDFYPLENYGGSLVLLTNKLYGEARYICPPFMIAGAAARAKKAAYTYIFDDPGSDGLTHHSADLSAFYNTTIEDPDGLFAIMRKEWLSLVFDGSTTSHDSWIEAGSDGWPRQWLHPGDYVSQTLDDGLKARCEFWRSTDAELLR